MQGFFLEGSFLKGFLEEGSFWKDHFWKDLLRKDLLGRIFWEGISREGASGIFGQEMAGLPIKWCPIKSTRDTSNGFRLRPGQLALVISVDIYPITDQVNISKTKKQIPMAILFHHNRKNKSTNQPSTKLKPLPTGLRRCGNQPCDRLSFPQLNN